MDTNDVVSVFNSVGTLISLILSVYAIYIATREKKPRLKIDAIWVEENKLEQNFAGEFVNQGFEKNLIFYIRNIGEKPVILYSARVESKNWTFKGIENLMVNSMNSNRVFFPCKIDIGEGIRIDSRTNFEGVSHIFDKETIRKAYLIFRDGTGSEYKCKIRNNFGNEKQASRVMKDFFD